MLHYFENDGRVGTLREDGGGKGGVAKSIPTPDFPRAEHKRRIEHFLLSLTFSVLRLRLKRGGRGGGGPSV